MRQQESCVLQGYSNDEEYTGILHERWLLQCLNKLHTGQENPLRFVLLESFKGKPEIWKQIEKDGKAISPAKFSEGRGKKSKALSDYHDQVRVKSNRGRKAKG